ncbi:MAG: HPr family phosphocarrier protein [Neobacillus sp.]|jgi:phosphotransferase system HPr (HPr) family protein
MIQQTVQIKSSAGLDGRAVTHLVQTASRFDSEIFLTYKTHRVNLKSIMGVLSLGVPREASVTFEVTGDDDQEALRELVKVTEEMA